MFRFARQISKWDEFLQMIKRNVPTVLYKLAISHFGGNDGRFVCPWDVFFSEEFRSNQGLSN